jgi:hypothetical protein
MAGRQGASPPARVQVRVSLVVALISHSKVVAEGQGLSRPDLRRQRPRVRLRVGAVENSEDNPGYASLARHLLAQLPAKRKEGKAPIVNRVGHQGADRPVQSSLDRGNQSAERKKARKNHRRQGHSSTNLL